jgi:carboxymethylenebutenolidase
MPNERWTIKTADGEFGAYVAKPEGKGPWPGLIVIQEIFGVNQVMRDIADGWAAEGYLAVCPDLFWRIEPGIDITDQTDAEMKRAFELFGLFNADKGISDISATLAHVRAQDEVTGKVGAVGFCLGGLLAYLTATRTDSDASVSYYGVGIQNHLGEATKLTNPLLLHIAGEDGFVPKEAQAEIVAALGDNPKISIHTYPGRDHAFARPGGANYDAADANLAHDRSAAFLAKALKS